MSQSNVKELESTASMPSAWVGDALAAARAARSTWSSPALASLVSAAEKSWSKILFPTTRIETWRYTNVEQIAVGAFRGGVPAGVVTALEIESFILKALNPYLIVLVNGRYDAALSSSDGLDGVTVLTSIELASGKYEEVATRFGATQVHTANSFAALATALMTDCVSISVARGKSTERPIQILSVVTKEADSAVVAPRVVVDVAELAEIRIIETHASLGGTAYLTLPIIEAFVADSARLHSTKIEVDEEASFHIAHAITEQGRASMTRGSVFSFGGKIVRNSVDIELKGTGCDATINGLSVLHEKQHVDNTTLIHHIEPSCESRELFKGIYADDSKGVFSGTIVVESEAQKTNAFQSNQTLLLSQSASIDTRPQLKIWADDVKCTHGATVGQLDEMAMFYLQSRGIDRIEAKRCLVKAFAGEVVSSLQCDELESYVGELLTAKLESLRSA